MIHSTLYSTKHCIPEYIIHSIDYCMALKQTLPLGIGYLNINSSKNEIHSNLGMYCTMCVCVCVCVCVFMCVYKT